MRPPRTFALFWIAVGIDVLALGIAWPTWKLVSTSPLALLVAIPATLVGVGATAVAGRVLTVVSRASRPGISEAIALRAVSQRGANR